MHLPRPPTTSFPAALGEVVWNDSDARRFATIARSVLANLPVGLEISASRCDKAIVASRLPLQIYGRFMDKRSQIRLTRRLKRQGLGRNR
jgi:hypothetical protein